MPITPEAVRARLAPPDMAQVRVQAGEIQHPILPPVALKPDEGLTPDGAAVLAVLLNPSLRAIRDQRALSRAQLLDAGLLPNPDLSFSLDVPSGGDTAGKTSAYGLGLDWNVTSLIARTPGVRAAKARSQAVDLGSAWQEWQVAQSAKAAVYALSSLQSRIALLEQVRSHLADNLARMRKAVTEGAMTSGAMNSTRVASAHTTENLLALEKQADRQRLKILRLIGLPPDTPIHLNRSIRLPSRVALPKTTALLDGLEQRRLDLLALRRGYDSQEAAVRAAVLSQFPRITIGPTLSRDTDGVRTIGFGLNIELPVFNRSQGRIAVERATRRKLFDEYVNRVFEARSDVEQIASGIHFLNRQIAAAKASEVHLQRLEKDYRTALSQGRTDALVYYAAWKELIGTRTNIAELQSQLAQAVVALELATGRYEIPGPGLSPTPTPKDPDVERAQ